VFAESGNLFTWGKNRDCQLGIPGLLDTEMLPVPVVLYPDIHQNPKLPRHAVAVACGANHGIGLVNRH
jgi:alpha-tubulin suppressor-like RCC1 family protein